MSAHGRSEALMPQRAARRLFCHARGFTLLELLVAITILSIVSVIAWRGLDSLVSTRERLEPEADDVRGLLAAFGQLERDLAQVPNPKFLGLTSSPIDVTVTEGSTLLQLSRVAPAAADRPTEVQTVFYRVADGTLMRQATAALPAFETTSTDRLETARLLRDVKTMQIRTWSPTGGWVDPAIPDPTGGGQQAGSVTPGVEVTLERSDGRTFRRVLLVGA